MSGAGASVDAIVLNSGCRPGELQIQVPRVSLPAVLEREPPAVSTVQPLAPAALDDIVRGCLAKDADERWQVES